MMKRAGTILLIVLMVPFHARAERLAMPTGYDALVVAGSLAVWGSMELMKDEWGPDRCRWCSQPSWDGAVHDALAWNDTHFAATASDVLLGSVVVGSMLAAQWRTEENGDGLAGMVVVLEAVSVSMALTQVVKFTVARERPYMEDVQDPSSRGRDGNLSFWSGHTASAFAGAVAGAWVYQLEAGEHPYLVWGLLVGGAATVGYLRMASEMHYLSDVVAGAAAGTAVAWLVTRLHVRKNQPPLAVAPLFMPGGMGLAFYGSM